MRRNLFLASAIVFAALASCTKESTLDPSIESAESAQTPISFTTYSSTATETKGTAVNSNEDFQSVGSFSVAALISDCDDLVYDYNSNEEGVTDGNYTITGYTLTPIAEDAVYYFGFKNVLYYGSAWNNQSQMYWPNYSRIIHFAAYSPNTASLKNDYTFEQSYSGGSSSPTYNYSFSYTVDDNIDKQDDLMYALTTIDYVTPSERKKKLNGENYVTGGLDYTNTEESVNLHFKHALTQIAFTATKDSEIDVYVKGITICNVYNSGKFTATAVTDDSDGSASGDSTVGNSGDAADQVNAGNFGTWITDFSGSWSGLYEKEVGSKYYYTTEGHSSMSNYATVLEGYSAMSPTETGSNNSIKISASGVTSLTSSSNVLMLIPQKLTPWVPTTSTVINYVGLTKGDALTGTTALSSELTSDLSDGSYAVSTDTDSQSYLTIDCEIYHKGADDDAALIHDGHIYVPFDTTGLDYNLSTVDNPDTTTTDGWLAGYKITYCLDFGGGYIVEEGHSDTVPAPGCIPDTETYTLRTITYTTSVDNYTPIVAASQDLDDFVNGVDTDTSYTTPTSSSASSAPLSLR